MVQNAPTLELATAQVQKTDLGHVDRPHLQRRRTDTPPLWVVVPGNVLDSKRREQVPLRELERGLTHGVLKRSGKQVRIAVTVIRDLAWIRGHRSLQNE